MESMLASEAEYQLADTFDTMRSLSDSFTRHHTVPQTDQIRRGQWRSVPGETWTKGREEERRPQGLHTHF